MSETVWLSLQNMPHWGVCILLHTDMCSWSRGSLGCRLTGGWDLPLLTSGDPCDPLTFPAVFWGVESMLYLTVVLS